MRELTRLFLRRLIDNDLISPRADRHESLVVLAALVLTLAVFVTFFISTDYLAAFIQLPGPTALSSLSDRFLFIAASMAVSALATLMVWEALPLEPRDAAILGPLPIPARTITFARLAAVLVFGASFAIALNAVPSVLYPAFLTMNLRGISGIGIVRLIAGQGMSVVMAGLFGFFAILALRGVLCLALGERGFRRLSSAVQSALIVGAIAALLLTPTVGAATVRNWIGGAVPPQWPAVPALWYLALNEHATGDVVVETPAVMPPRTVLVPGLRRRDEAARAAYRTLVPRFAALARIAWRALPSLAVLAIVTFLWTNRRLPEHTAARGRSRPRASVRSLAERLTRRSPESQAGFFFTVQILTRSAPHRLVFAASVAAALTLPLITLVRGGVSGAAPASTMPLGVFGMQIEVLLSLLVGFRYAVTIPAELASNWTIRMAWLGDERGYLAGAKRAALLALVGAPLLALLPIHAAVFGAGIALAHSLYGALFAVAVLDLLFLGYRKLPFACSYVPIENIKLVGCAVAASFVLVTYGFAFVERQALQSAMSSAALGVALAGLVGGIRLIDRAQRRERFAVDFDEGPAPATQRLGLGSRMGIEG